MQSVLDKKTAVWKDGSGRWRCTYIDGVAEGFVLCTEVTANKTAQDVPSTPDLGAAPTLLSLSVIAAGEPAFYDRVEDAWYFYVLHCAGDKQDFLS